MIYLSICTSVCQGNIDPLFMYDLIYSSCSYRPVSLVVVLILIRADQLVGAGLISQQA